MHMRAGMTESPRAEGDVGMRLRAGAQEFKKAFEEAMAHNEKLLAEDEAAGESRGEEAPAEAAAREASKKVPGTWPSVARLHQAGLARAPQGCKDKLPVCVLNTLPALGEGRCTALLIASQRTLLEGRCCPS